MATPAAPRQIVLQTGMPNRPVLHDLPILTGNKYINVSGTCDPGVMVEVYVAHVVDNDYDSALNSTVLRGIIRGSSLGEFMLTYAELFEGENLIYAIARDDVNNLSNMSATKTITYEPEAELQFEVPPPVDMPDTADQRQKAYTEVVFQYGKDILPGELNEAQKIQLLRRNLFVADMLSDGVLTGLELPTEASTGGSYPYYPYQTTEVEGGLEFAWPNFMFITAGVFYFAGRRLEIEKNGLNKANTANLLTFEPPPVSGARIDLVYLVVWEKTVGPVDVLRAYGHQSHPTILDNDIKNRVYNKETTKRMQMQFDIKVAKGVADVGELDQEAGKYYFSLYSVERSSGQTNIRTSDATDLRPKAWAIAPDSRIDELASQMTTGYDPGHLHRVFDVPIHVHSEVSDIKSLTSRLAVTEGANTTQYTLTSEVLAVGDLMTVYDAPSGRIWQVPIVTAGRGILSNGDLVAGDDLPNYNDIDFDNLTVTKYESVVFNTIVGHNHDGVNSRELDNDHWHWSEDCAWVDNRTWHFTGDLDPEMVEEVEVFVDGVLKKETTHYTISESDVVFEYDVPDGSWVRLKWIR